MSSDEIDANPISVWFALEMIHKLLGHDADYVSRGHTQKPERRLRPRLQTVARTGPPRPVRPCAIRHSTKESIGWSARTQKNCSNASAQHIRFRAFEVDLRARGVNRNGAKLKLQEQPFQILRS